MALLGCVQVCRPARVLTSGGAAEQTRKRNRRLQRDPVLAAETEVQLSLAMAARAGDVAQALAIYKQALEQGAASHLTLVLLVARLSTPTCACRHQGQAAEPAGGALPLLWRGRLAPGGACCSRAASGPWQRASGRQPV